MKVKKLNEADFTYITKNGEIWKYHVHIYDKRPFKVTDLNPILEEKEQHRINSAKYDSSFMSFFG